MADELLHALGGLSLGHVRGPLDQREVELATDHGRHRHEAPPPVGEALQAMLHELMNSRRQGESLGQRDGLALAERMHHFDHHEGVAIADPPCVLGEVRDQLVGKPGRSERPNEGAGVGARQGGHGQSCQLASLVELVQRLSEEIDVRQLLLADRGHHQERDLVEPPPEEGQEADAHLVGPVDVLQHDDQRLPSSEALEELADRLEWVAGIPAALARDLRAGEEAVDSS